MNIKIGADELILWLRKNNKAKKDTTTQLGLKILNLIESLNGQLEKHDEKCYWDTDKNFESIDKLKLPMTASQYTIDSNRIGELYIHLNNW